MDHNNSSSQLRAILNDVLGLEDSDSLHDEDLSVSNGKEYDHGEDGIEEEEDAMYDDSYTNEQYTTGPVEEHNHELELTLSHFLPCHKELSRTLKRSLVAPDITGLMPSKIIKLLEVKAGGPTE
ncbi:hypothetical protein BC332_18720 [Capsicum chinense]|nr:hypothetical protein BC332_18720 [Capsicum chinense]